LKPHTRINHNYMYVSSVTLSMFDYILDECWLW